MSFSRNSSMVFYNGWDYCCRLLISLRSLIAPDIAQAAAYMLQLPINVSVKALDIVPTGMC
jgi:NADP-dependent 3-hydroxy acid dehydrogenase YdfG